MSQFVFSDEAGCFTFERKPNVSKYFILCTVTMTELEVGNALQQLRRRLIWEKADLGDYFHATSDKQAVRDEVYSTILNHEFRVQATIVEKCKARPHIRSSRALFYKYPWFYHFKHGIAGSLSYERALLVTASAIGNKKEKLSFTNAINDVMKQTLDPSFKWAVDFRPCSTDPCLQVADYCAWAIQRKWESKDLRSYELIKSRITYEYDLWAHGAKTYY